jgi:release factor glutamine methyltransferase
MEEMKTLDRAEAFRKGVSILKGAGIADPALDASVLLGYAIGVAPGAVLLERSAAMTADESDRFAALIDRRSNRETVSRLVGNREFFSMRFRTGTDVLDPRPETELLVERALESLKKVAGQPKVLDLGTGSGVIAVALSKTDPRVSVVATDISFQALKTASANARDHGVCGRVRFVQADLLRCFPDTPLFDLLVSNPPYVSCGEYPNLPAEVRFGDPVGALVAGPLGTEFFEPLMRSARTLLRPEGTLLVEVGAGQSSYVEELFRGGGFLDVATFTDLSGIGRVVKGENPDV